MPDLSSLQPLVDLASAKAIFGAFLGFCLAVLGIFMFGVLGDFFGFGY